VGKKMLSTNEALKKETIFTEFRTEDVVSQYFLIAIIQYLQFVKFEVEKASQSNVDLEECAFVLIHVIGQYCVVK
jgi:hypothetical protein